MKVQNLTLWQKFLLIRVLDAVMLFCVWHAITSISYLMVTGEGWLTIVVWLVLLYYALKLRPFDDPFRSAARFALSKA